MKHIHFIGIGGISMSALAMILKSRGYEVTGSDITYSDAVRQLEEAEIKVNIGQVAENITPDMDVIVYTAALKEDNPELVAARALGEKTGAEVLPRAELLGRIGDEYPISIGIAGTHGKTSTSSMLSVIYLAAGLDPSFVIGGIVSSTGSTYRIGHGQDMILEACEYTDSFLHLHPNYTIITNIEEDHLDYFTGGLPQIQKSFVNYARGMKPNGIIVTSPELAPLFEGLPQRIVTVQTELTDTSADGRAASASSTAAASAPDCYASQIEHPSNTIGQTFHLHFKGQDLGEVFLPLPGRHMVYDALLCAAMALTDDVPFEAVREGLSHYHTTKKRFEYLGTWNGVKIVDDYAHHPTEIKAMLTSAKELTYNEMYVAFQPHTYSRTLAFFDDFAEALSLADHVVLLDIYAAREQDEGLVSSQKLRDSLVQRGTDAHYFASFEDAEKFLKKNLSTNDLLITMGAGNAVKIANDLLQEA